MSKRNVHLPNKINVFNNCSVVNQIMIKQFILNKKTEISFKTVRYREKVEIINSIKYPIGYGKCTIKSVTRRV